MDVTVVIPAYNCERTIALALEALITQDYSDKISIVAVDDGSTDTTADRIKKFPQVLYVYQDNSGPAAARNAGARQTQGELICFTDSDCVPRRDWVRRLAAHFDRPEIGAVAGSYAIANPEELLARCVHAEIIYRHKRMPEHIHAFGSYNVCIRREIFEKCGGFDAAYRHASGEDNDLSYKVLARGYKISFAKDALVDHFHPVSLRGYLKDQYRHGFWRAKMYREHPAMARGDDYTFWKDIVEIPLALAVIAGILLWPAGPAVAGPAAVIIAALLAVLELSFACVMIERPAAVVYLASVLFLRTFFRAFGFLAGIFRPVVASRRS